MTDHTPGPWVLGLKYDNKANGWPILADGAMVAYAVYRGGTAKAQINARLIASAPDLKHQRDMLLKALETLMGSVREKIGRDARSVEIWNNAVLACAKAGPSQECEDKS